MESWMYLLLAGLAACTVFQILIYAAWFSRLWRYRAMASENDGASPAVSVIICARNEQKNLQQYLHHFLNQKYHTFEVVVVNDGSTDESWELLLQFQKKYPNLTAVNVPFATPPGKKAALAAGIAQAKHEVLLLSDADCRPVSDQWIALMTAPLKSKREIVLGYSPYERCPGLLNAFIRFETVYTAIQYFSFAWAGMPYMGVGRNLLYTRSLFRRTGGFEAHLHKASGDDDLFVNAAANAENTGMVLHPGAFVVSVPQRSWSGYYYQKSRHFSTGSSYRMRHQVLLGAIALSHSLHYALLLALLIAAPEVSAVASLMYLSRMAVVAGVFGTLLHKFEARDLWKWVPLMDALLPLYYLIFSKHILQGNSTSWKQ